MSSSIVGYDLVGIDEIDSGLSGLQLSMLAVDTSDDDEVMNGPEAQAAIAASRLRLQAKRQGSDVDTGLVVSSAIPSTRDPGHDARQVKRKARCTKFLKKVQPQPVSVMSPDPTSSMSPDEDVESDSFEEFPDGLPYCKYCLHCRCGKLNHENCWHCNPQTCLGCGDAAHEERWKKRAEEAIILGNEEADWSDYPVKEEQSQEEQSQEIATRVQGETKEIDEKRKLKAESLCQMKPKTPAREALKVKKEVPGRAASSAGPGKAEGETSEEEAHRERRRRRRRKRPRRSLTPRKRRVNVEVKEEVAESPRREIEVKEEVAESPRRGIEVKEEVAEPPRRESMWSAQSTHTLSPQNMRALKHEIKKTTCDQINEIDNEIEMLEKEVVDIGSDDSELVESNATNVCSLKVKRRELEAIKEEGRYIPKAKRELEAKKEPEIEVKKESDVEPTPKRRSPFESHLSSEEIAKNIKASMLNQDKHDARYHAAIRAGVSHSQA